jgi:hypothetical protein
MAFVYKKSLNPNGGRELVNFLIADSKTLQEGEAVKLTGDALTIEDFGAAGGAVAGVVVGFQKADGSPVTDNGAGGAYTGTYTTGTSNTVEAVIDISRKSLYSVELDAAAGTTAGSDMRGYKIDHLASGVQLDESTAATTSASWVIFDQDPDGDAPDNSVLVMIYESPWEHIAA